MRILIVVLLVIAVMLAMPGALLAQDDGEGTPGGDEPPVFVETDDPEVALELVVGFLSFVVAGALEAIKRGPLKLLRNYVTIPDEAYSGLLMVLAAVMGIGLAWWAELDLFMELGRPAAPELGYIAMGFLLAAGDVIAYEVIHGVRTGNKLLNQHDRLRSGDGAPTSINPPEAIPQG